jgi:PAS domain S-box-containing protein
MDAKKSLGKDKEEILIVDESPTEAERLRRILEQQGYHVSTAPNGLEALDLMGKHKPMLVISDIVMQEMDGYQLCRQMRTDEKLKNIPLIFLTPLSDPIDIIKALECGADNYIVKPYEEKYLLNQVLYFLTRKVEREGVPSEMGLEIFLQGKRYLINSDRLQILNLLISRYEESEEMVWNLADSLQEMVEERTADLKEEVINHKRTAELVRESERRYRLLIENIPAVVFQGYADWTVDFFDDKIEDLIGTKKELFISRRMKWSDVVLREDLESLKESTRKALKLDKSYVREYRVRDKEGKIIWIQERSQINCDKDGKIEYISGVFYDITERKRAEEAIKESEHYYRSLLHSMHEDILVVDRDYMITDVNRTFLTTSGREREEVVGRHCYRVSHGYNEPCRRYGEECLLPEVFETGKPDSCRHQHMHVDGSKVWVDVLLSPLTDRVGNVTHVIEAIREVDDLIRTEMEFRASEKKYRLLVENIPAVVFQGYADWTVDFFDDKIEDLIGYKKEEFDSRRMKWSNVVVKEDLESLKKATKKALKLDKSYVREYRVRDKEGKIIWIQERSQIICDKDGRIEYISGVFYNITERWQRH